MFENTSEIKLTSEEVLEKILPLKKPESLIQGIDKVKPSDLEMTRPLADNQIGLTIIVQGRPYLLGYFLPKPAYKVEKNPGDIDEMSKYMADWETLINLLKPTNLDKKDIDDIILFVGSQTPKTDIKFTIDTLQEYAQVRSDQIKGVTIEKSGSSIILDPVNNEVLMAPLEVGETNIKLKNKKQIQKYKFSID